MRADFKNTTLKITNDLGCDNVCLETCLDHSGTDNIPRCLKRCHCGKGVIEINGVPVNTMAIVEKEYGDVENLSEEDMDTISESLALMWVIYRY